MHLCRDMSAKTMILATCCCRRSHKKVYFEIEAFGTNNLSTHATNPVPKKTQLITSAIVLFFNAVERIYIVNGALQNIGTYI